MKAYSEYKSSGIEWLSEIPSHWDSMPLKYTVKNQETDFIDGDWIESPFITETGIRYLTSGNVGPGFYKEQGNGFISDETFDELHCIEVLPGDLLISRLNEPIARTCEVPDLGYKIVTCVDNVIYRPISDIFSRRFMMYQLNSEPFWFNASGLSSGATMKRISRSKLGNIKVIVPSLKEQELIATYLDDVIGKVDALIAEKRKQVENLRAYRTSLITETVTRGLNPETPFRPSGIDWLGNIPQHWLSTKAKYYIEIKSGDVISKDDISAEGAYPVFGGGEVIGYSNKTNLSKDTIIIGRVEARCGCTHLVECDSWATDNALVVQTTQNSNYFYWLFSAANLNRLNESNAQPLLTATKIKDLGIPLPPLSEQKEIADFLDAKTTKIDALIDELCKQLDELTEYRQAVISEAVTGKVDVRDWTPKS